MPDIHGIVANTFWDPQRQELYKMSNLKTRNDASYYGGEPIWITAQKQGIKTGNIYRVGSDIYRKRTAPTHYHVYDQKPRLTQTERVAEALRMLEAAGRRTPQLVMIYFEDSDTYGHTYSPHSKETRRCVEELDALMKYLWEGLQSLPFRKGHQPDCDIRPRNGDCQQTTLYLSKHLLNEKWYTLIDGNLPAQIYTKPEYRDSVYRHYRD